MMELENKFLVLKWDDINEYLQTSQRDMLESIVWKIWSCREAYGKPASNNYVVINQDEPYFPAVLKLMEEAEQVTSKAEETARRRSQGAKDGWEIRKAKQEGSAS